ncbi:helix-turn-helix domain-containing protein [Caulobacter sp. 73W]|uniref:Helix-turn-helix domain-containing protein n=1 Tax=Caulobacter sp. 73W TaxID=3161137 RepID=A0AB39KTK2_9CAUL
MKYFYQISTRVEGAMTHRLVRDPAQVRLLSSPARQEIVDTLSALGGEASVASLADELGRPADGLYYHLRALVAGGLVEEVRASEQEERRFRLAGAGEGPLRLAYDLGPEGNAAELALFAQAMLKIAHSDFEAALTCDPTVAGTRRELWASRNKGWLSEADLSEVVTLLERLSSITSQPRAPGRDRLMSVSFCVAPLVVRAKRRGT